VHALWTLEGFNATDASVLKKALQNSTPGVRENAILIAELHLNDFPQLEKELLALQSDPSAKVRYQLLCTLGNLHDGLSQSAQQKILMKDVNDKWVQVAALTSSKGNEMILLEKSIGALSSSPSEGKALFFSNCANLIGLSKRTDDIKKVFQLSLNNNSPKSDWWQAASLKGLSTSISEQGIPPGNFEEEKSVLLSRFSAGNSPLVRSASIDLLHDLGITENDGWRATLTKAKAVAENPKENQGYRNDATRLLALDKKGDYHLLLEKIVTSEEPVGLQKTALQTYNQLEPKSACDFIVNNWKSLSKDLRDVAMDIFVSSISNSSVLLDAVKNGTIQSTSISWRMKEQLANSDDSSVRNRSRQLIISEIESREKVYNQYLPVLNTERRYRKRAGCF
jgi:hypothetical protein